MSAQQKTPPETPDSAALGEEVRRVISQFVRRVRQETGTLRHSQHETLELLERQGPLSVAELASMRGVKHQSMRLVVAELETQRQVYRSKDPDDGRAQRVALTPQAEALLQSARAERSAWVAKAIDHQLNPADRADLIKGLQALSKLLNP